MAKPIKDKKRIIIIVAVVLLLMAASIEVFFVGNIAYLQKWKECGNKPYISSEGTSIGFGSHPKGALITNHPSFLDTKKTTFYNDPFYTHMSCNLDEAKSYYTDGYYDILREVD